MLIQERSTELDRIVALKRFIKKTLRDDCASVRSFVFSHIVSWPSTYSQGLNHGDKWYATKEQRIALDLTHNC